MIKSIVNKVLRILLIICVQRGLAQVPDTSRTHLEIRAGFGLSTFLADQYFPLKRATFIATDLQVLLGKNQFKLILGIGYNRVGVKHYPALIRHQVDSNFIEGTWKRIFGFYSINAGVSFRPVRKLGLEIRQIFGLSVYYKMVDNYNFPEYDDGLVLNEVNAKGELKFLISTSVDYFYPVGNFEIGVGFVIMKRFDNKGTYAEMFNYGGGLALRYNL